MSAIRDVLLGPVYIVRAMLTTLKHNTRPIVTIEYPERQKAVPPRERGRHILHRYANGLEKCVGCELCAIACPVGCIVVEAAENTPERRVRRGRFRWTSPLKARAPGAAAFGATGRYPAAYV